MTRFQKLLFVVLAVQDLSTRSPAHSSVVSKIIAHFCTQSPRSQLVHTLQKKLTQIQVTRTMCTRQKTV